MDVYTDKPDKGYTHIMINRLEKKKGLSKNFKIEFIMPSQLFQISHAISACKCSISTPFLIIAPCSFAFFRKTVSEGL